MGEPIRRLSGTAARSPRWISGDSKLVFIGLEGGGSDLRRLDSKKGAEEVVAPIDFGPGCDPDEWESDEPGWTREELDLTNEDELWVAADGRHVCLVAADHSADLRDVAEVHVFDVHHSTTERLLIMAAPDCGRGPEHPMPPACDQSRADDVSEPAPTAPAAIGGYVESTAPGGTWQLVDLADALGDVVHSRRWGGRLGGRLARRRRWAPPRWIGPNHLVVGRQLLVAGERVVDLPGDLAL